MADRRITTHLCLSGPPWRQEIADRIAPKARDAGNDAGSGSFSLLNSSSNHAIINPGNVVAYAYDGGEEWWQVVETINQTTLAEGEENDQKTSYEGRGLLAELERAVVYPHPPLNRQPIGDIRYFDFSSLELETAHWTPAVVRFRQCSDERWTPPPNGLFSAPDPWPDPEGHWIAPRPMIGDRDPVGSWYVRKHFVLSQPEEIVIYVAADDSYDFRIDGEPLISWTDADPSQRKGDGWMSTRFVRLTMSAGPHIIAAKITNYDHTGFNTINGNAGNISVFICAVYHMVNTSMGETQELLFRTDGNGWICLDYPGGPPGFTPTRIIRLLMGEAIARGALPSWTFGFSDALDSAGFACPTTPDVSFRYGTSLLDVCKQLGEGWIEFAARLLPNSATRQLQVWAARQPGSAAPGRGIDRALTVEVGVNTTELNHTADVGGLRTTMLVRDETGYFDLPAQLQPNQDPNYAYPAARWEGYLSLNETKERSSAFAIAQSAVNKTSIVETMTIGQWVPTNSGEAPGTGYQVGDRIWARARSGALQQVNVAGVSAVEDDTGKLLAAPELESLVADQHRQFDRWMTRTANGTLDGRSEAATPGPIRTLDSGVLDSATFGWSQSSPEIATGSPETLKRPIKFIRISLAGDDFDEDKPPSPSAWFVTRAPIFGGAPEVVAGLTLQAGELEASACLLNGPYGGPGMKFNAGVVLTGHHKGMSLDIDFVFID